MQMWGQLTLQLAMLPQHERPAMEVRSTVHTPPTRTPLWILQVSLLRLCLFCLMIPHCCEQFDAAVTLCYPSLVDAASPP